MYIPLLLPLSLSLAVQFALWINLLLPYNPLFENFNRNYYLIFSFSGFLGACISLIFYRMLVFERVNKIAFAITSILQFFCLLSCAVFFTSSLTGWWITLI